MKEGSLNLPKSKRFIKYHGNYCGPGNRGGTPVDALDRACQKHDVGYHHTATRKQRRVHDRSFTRAADEIARSKEHPLRVRAKAKVASLFFKTRNILHKEEGMAEEKEKPEKSDAKKKADIVKKVRKEFGNKDKKDAADTKKPENNAPEKSDSKLSKKQSDKDDDDTDSVNKNCQAGKGQKDKINTDPEINSTISTPMSYV